MLSPRYLIIPFALQMTSMAFDELYYHRRRDFPRWERLGHPLDTATVLACFAWVLFKSPDSSSIGVYVALCVLSCLFVTKDEPVHSRFCDAGEQWLHAVLFLLHPLVLLSAGLLWPAASGSGRSAPWLRYEGYERALMLGVSGMTLVFGLYQLIYWNLIWRPGPEKTQTIV
jgi:hypothetical protein